MEPKYNDSFLSKAKFHFLKFIFILYFVHAQLLQPYLILCNPMDIAHQAPLSMGFSDKNTGLGCLVFLQGIFLTQGLNPCLLYYSWILYN